MGLSPEGHEEPESPPPPPGANKVEITVAGHTVVVESADPLADVVGYATSIFESTRWAAERIPVGFDVTGGQFERAEPYRDPSSSSPYEEDDDARRMDRHQRDPQTFSATRRLANPDTPGGYRARWRPVPMDPEQHPLP